MSGFDRLIGIMANDNYPNERGIINLTHFNGTRKSKPNKQGFYKRNHLVRNWRFELANGKSGTFKYLKDNGNNTFTGIPKGLFNRTVTESWNNLIIFD